MSDLGEDEMVPTRERNPWTVWESRPLDDGRWIAMEPTIWHGFRMHVIDDLESDRSSEMFTFPDPVSAALAFIAWDGSGEPSGWVRHQPSDRRRPDGDPSKEYVSP